jgi:hypothetical protein
MSFPLGGWSSATTTNFPESKHSLNVMVFPLCYFDSLNLIWASISALTLVDKLYLRDFQKSQELSDTIDDETIAQIRDALKRDKICLIINPPPLEGGFWNPRFQIFGGPSACLVYRPLKAS